MQILGLTSLDEAERSGSFFTTPSSPQMSRAPSPFRSAETESERFEAGGLSAQCESTSSPQLAVLSSRYSLLTPRAPDFNSAKTSGPCHSDNDFFWRFFHRFLIFINSAVSRNLSLHLPFPIRLSSPSPFLPYLLRFQEQAANLSSLSPLPSDNAPSSPPPPPANSQHFFFRPRSQPAPHLQPPPSLFHKVGTAMTS